MTDKTKEPRQLKNVIVNSLEVQGYVIWSNNKKTPFSLDVQSFTADTVSRIFQEIQGHFE